MFDFPITNATKSEQYEYYVLRNDMLFDIEAFIDFDAIIIEGSFPDFTKWVLKKIRSHTEPSIYLKPIFLFKDVSSKDVWIEHLIDGHTGSLTHLEETDLITARIKDKITELFFPKSISFEAQIINKTINLLYTRNKLKLIPRPYINSLICYTFPELSINFDVNDEFKLIELMDIAEKEGLFTSEFFERIYLCSNCHGSYLNYREVCPKCNSSDSEAEDLIHHFPCAYIGKLSDFKNAIDDELNCPKCNKTLRHIGVDYDKPALLYTCNDCSHQYQDFNVKAKCLKCNTENDVDRLVPKTIKEYQLTSKGKSAAIHGFIGTSKDLDAIPGTVKFDVFKIMLDFEIERLRQNDYTSNIAYINIKNSGEIYSRIGMDRQKLLIKDLIAILRKNIRSSDFITFYDSSTLLISFNDIPTKIASNILSDIKELTIKLLNRTFKKVEIDIDTNVVKLETSIEQDVQIQRLISSIKQTKVNSLG